MMLDLSASLILSFLTAVVLLALYSYLDMRNRRVPNGLVLAGGILALAIILLSGHLQNRLLLHLSAFVFVLVLSYLLFRIGAFGGADVKVLLVITLVIPGLELSGLSNPLFESILSAGLQMLVMLLGGLGYARHGDHAAPPPLIPFLFLGYLAVQLFAFA